MLKNLFNPNKYSTNIDLLLLICRVAVAVFMLSHGMGKFSKLFGVEPIAFADPIGIGTTLSLALTVFAEVFCSLLVLFGLATRMAALPLIITMLVAVFVVHLSDPFGKKELGLLYILIYLILLVAGPGKYSIDNWIYKKLNPEEKKTQ